MRKLMLIGLVLASCSDEPEPEPRRNPLMQLLVTNEPNDDPLSGLMIIRGGHDDINGGVPAEPMRARNVPRSGAQFRLVTRTLLEHRRVEAPVCLGGGIATFDPVDACATCPDDAATGENESGRCSDENGDDIPDDWALLPGLATIECAGGFVYSTRNRDGYFQPSGNQTLHPGFGLNGLGPSLVLEPDTLLPADADCTITFDDSIPDNDERLLVYPGPVGFHTAR